VSRHVEAERLSAFRDGDLPERDAAVVRAHLEVCADCAAVSSELGAHARALRTFDRSEPPPTLWAGIEGGLERSERRWSWPSLLAGAFAGVSVAAVVALLAWGVVGQQRGTALQAQDRGAAASGLGGAEVLGAAALDRDPLLVEAERELDRAAASYEQAVTRLRKIVEREQERWDAETRARVSDRLARLDEAVAHSRAVARRDPGDASGADMLFSAYRRQIDFLAEVVHRGSPAGGDGLR